MTFLMEDGHNDPIVSGDFNGSVPRGESESLSMSRSSQPTSESTTKEIFDLKAWLPSKEQTQQLSSLTTQKLSTLAHSTKYTVSRLKDTVGSRKAPARSKSVDGSDLFNMSSFTAQQQDPDDNDGLMSIHSLTQPSPTSTGRPKDRYYLKEFQNNRNRARPSRSYSWDDMELGMAELSLEDASSERVVEQDDLNASFSKPREPDLVSSSVGVIKQGLSNMVDKAKHYSYTTRETTK